ncbi:MAG: VapC toxin family PIN domain ribonuclease, partial [bacterium]|nr:VapC toxin family PIN domain ribonuclease [bacterium]
GQIAAIARSRGMAVATRNIRHFEGMAVDLVDPWKAS